MATTTFCDWCGERLELGDDETFPFGLKAQGRGENGDFFNLFLGFAAHVGDMDSLIQEPDPESCFGQLMALLDERKKWAHDRDQPGAEWRLVDRQGRLKGVVPRRRRAANPTPGPSEEERARWSKWKGFSKDERKAKICEVLQGAADLTAREVGDCLEQEDMMVCTEQVRPLLREMTDAGELARQEERWGRGSRLRFRYSISDSDEVTV